MDVLAADLQHYLQESRNSLISALDELSEYDVRRPVMPSGTNLLGLIKHLATMEASYLGECLGRPAPFELPWVTDGSIWDSADMWATPDQSRDYLVNLYRAAWAHSDTAVAEMPLESAETVSWWPEEQRSRRSDICSPEWSPRLPSTQGTPTSLARPSTPAAARTTETSATTIGGTTTSRGSRRRPTTSDEHAHGRLGSRLHRCDGCIHPLEPL